MSSAVRVSSLPPLSENYLLSSIPELEVSRLLDRAKHIKLEVGYLLLEQNEPIPYVYFITSGLASAVVVTREGKSVELGSVGHEGVVGTPMALGESRSPFRCGMQIAGSAWRVPSTDVRRAFDQGGALHLLFRRYLYARFMEVAYSSVCNLCHTVEQRLARWLLTAQERAGVDLLPLTHEDLSQMLGARRSTISLVAGQLERAGLISLQRGRMRILDRTRLERSACECYGIIKAEFQRVVP